MTDEFVLVTDFRFDGDRLIVRRSRVRRLANGALAFRDLGWDEA